MSKSRGNVVSPTEVLEYFARMLSTTVSTPTEASSTLAADCLRYCLVRSICLNADADFGLASATETVNTELVNWLGNLLSRWASSTFNFPFFLLK